MFVLSSQILSSKFSAYDIGAPSREVIPGTHLMSAMFSLTPSSVRLGASVPNPLKAYTQQGFVGLQGTCPGRQVHRYDVSLLESKKFDRYSQWVQPYKARPPMDVDHSMV